MISATLDRRMLLKSSPSSLEATAPPPLRPAILEASTPPPAVAEAELPSDPVPEYVPAAICSFTAFSPIRASVSRMASSRTSISSCSSYGFNR